jgi:hypothetical protein
MTSPTAFAAKFEEICVMADFSFKQPQRKGAARLSADQCRAISGHLIAHGDVVRGEWFKSLSKIAWQEDWPSSATAPFALLTEDESASLWNGDADTRQRVFAPYLTPTELAALRQSAKKAGEFYRKALAREPTPAEIEAERSGDEWWERRIRGLREQEAKAAR